MSLAEQMLILSQRARKDKGWEEELEQAHKEIFEAANRGMTEIYLICHFIATEDKLKEEGFEIVQGYYYTLVKWGKED